MERRTLLLVLFFATVCLCKSANTDASSGSLYVLSSVWYNPPARETPAALLQVDIQTNTTTEIMNWRFPNSTYVVGTAFDKFNMIYYMVHNQQVGNREQSFLTAINVSNRSFAIDGLELDTNKLILWDIDIDSAGNIHYLARESLLQHEFIVLASYHVWDAKVQRSAEILNGIALAQFGSVAYVEESETLVVCDQNGRVTTIGNDGAITSFPRDSSIFSQGSIEWNNVTNSGYIFQWTTTTQISSLEKLTNVYPVVCPITVNSKDWSTVTAISDASALNPTNNYYSFVMEEVSAEYLPNTVDAILTVNLDTCEQYWMFLSHGHEVQIGGPEYAYAV